MLVEVSHKIYRGQFPFDPVPYISQPFIENVKSKVERIVYLLEDSEKVALGLVAGIKDAVLLSPFSAPFGGFHFRHNTILTSEMDHFIDQLVEYTLSQNIKMMKFILPPDIYHHSFNSKMANALLRSGFQMDLPEITNWINLYQFNGEFCCRNARQNYHKSLRYNLSFNQVDDLNDEQEVYQTIFENRHKLGRPIYMSFEDLKCMENIWPVDFFKVSNVRNEILAGAIFYRGHKQIVQGVFWGDNEYGRNFRAMDFCAHNLWSHYKRLGYEIIDLGTSSLCGTPSDGLIRFKENHDCVSALRLCFNMNLTLKMQDRLKEMSVAGSA